MEDNMSENKYLYGEIENTAFIKAIGNSTMKNSKTASDILDKLLNGEKKEVKKIKRDKISCELYSFLASKAVKIILTKGGNKLSIE